MNVICSGTSIPSRINTTHRVIQSLLNQSHPPKLVILNLSIEEFPNGYADLPQELLELADTELRFIINFVLRNTYTFKKVLPMYNYNSDNLVFSYDDDIEYSSDLLRKFLDSYEYYSKIFPEGCCITVNTMMNNQEFELVGNATLYSPNSLSDWEYYLTDDWVATKHDDRFYQCLLRSKGIPVVPIRNILGEDINRLGYDSSWINSIEDTVKLNSELDKDQVRFDKITNLLKLMNSGMTMHGQLLSTIMVLSKYKL